MDEQRRRFLFNSVGVLGAISAFFAAVPFVSSWFPNAKVKASGSAVQVDVSQLKPGQQMTLEWQGKPVWIIRRTQEMLAHLSDNENQLRDPDSLVQQQPSYAKNRYRSINPEYFIVIGVCTHLGCSPKYKPDENEWQSNWAGGFYCPCHGSTFDLSGRVFKGVPAPINLEVPPYRFVSDRVIRIGESV